MVRSGVYGSVDDAVRHAVGDLQVRHRTDQRQLASLKPQIQEGLTDLDRGDFIECDDATLDAVLDEVMAFVPR